MAVDLQQHIRDTTTSSSFPSSQFQYDDVVSLSQHHNNKNNNKGSYLRALLRSMEVHNHDNNDDNNNNTNKNEDLIDELSHHMDRFLLQDDDDKFDYSNIGSSNNLDLTWDLIGSPQSTVWSTLGSNQGSSEGSSQEPSPPATPCWKSSQDLMGSMCDKVKVIEEISGYNNSKYQYLGNNEIQKTLKATSKSNIDLCSYQSLIQEQIRAIELSKFKQERNVVPPAKQKQKHSHGESERQKSKHYDPKQEIQQTHKKGGKGVVGNGRRTTSTSTTTTRPPRPAPVALQQLLSHQQQTGPGMRALFLGGPGSSGGTGVFFPRSGVTNNPPPSYETTTKKQGKGCATVLIPSRVVQALQLHFDQMSATSGTKAGAFPPLHDVLVSNRDGMYSLQKPQSQEAPENMQNEMLLPQEWTY